jgi:hypothetical protein
MAGSLLCTNILATSAFHEQHYLIGWGNLYLGHGHNMYISTTHILWIALSVIHRGPLGKSLPSITSLELFGHIEIQVCMAHLLRNRWRSF